MVIACNPSVEARAILYMLNQLASLHNVLLIYHVHSSVKNAPRLDLSKSGFQSGLVGEGRARSRATVVVVVMRDMADIPF